MKLISTMLLLVTLSIPPSFAEDGELDDAAIKSGVINALRGVEHASEFDAEVTVAEGIVTLSGEIESLVTKNLSAKAASTIRGVRAIINDLEVKEIPKGDDVIAGNLSDLFGLHHPFRENAIDYRVNDGVVTLTGTVTSFALKRLAEKTASAVVGVRSVANLLKVKPLKQADDEEIRQHLALLLKINPWVKDKFVKISIGEGVADINGAVDSYAERNRLLSTLEVSGAHTINSDELVVSPQLRPKMERPHQASFLTDDEMKQALEDAYRQDYRLDSSRVEIELIDGNITLSGNVESLGAKAAAEEVATNLPGANYMYSFLVVEGPDWASDTAIEAALTLTYELDSELQTSKIEHTVEDHVVTLEGMADSVYQRRRIVEIAAETVGVKRVINKIRVDWSTSDETPE